MVAYRLLARGHELLLQIPVRLYGFLQKFPVSILDMKLQWLCLITCHITSSCCILMRFRSSSFCNKRQRERWFLSNGVGDYGLRVYIWAMGRDYDIRIYGLYIYPSRPMTWEYLLFLLVSILLPVVLIYIC